MTTQSSPLTFSEIDGLSFAAAAEHLNAAQLPGHYVPNCLGPLLELLYLVAGGQMPSVVVRRCLAPNGARHLIAALDDDRERWLSGDRRLGFIRTLRSGPLAGNCLTEFLMSARRAARDVSRLPGPAPVQLVAAMEELENNIHEHSEASDTGILAFRAAPDVFEFVAADRGIGIMESLRRCPEFAAMTDHGRAMEEALADGTSRFGSDGGRGLGFRSIFLGLLYLYGSLRFRTGDHTLTMDGNGPKPSSAQLAQKPAIKGFFASVLCRNTGPTLVNIPLPHGTGRVVRGKSETGELTEKQHAVQEAYCLSRELPEVAGPVHCWS